MARAAVHEENKAASKDKEYNHGKDKMIIWMWQQQVHVQWTLLA